MRNDLASLVSALARGRSLDGRAPLADRLELMELLEGSLLEDARPAGPGHPRTELASEARALYARMDSANRALYEEIRSQIRRDERPDWPGMHVAVAGQEGYDYLDALVNGVLQPDLGGTDIAALHAEMVPYQPTPARHIFDLIRRTVLAESDTFVDLGSGLGHVALMMNICTGVRAIGIEIEKAYVDCARRSAAALNLAGVSFVQQDARLADLSTGTIFYLYTPFKGSILREVLDALRRESLSRPIRVCTYGPCTLTVAEEPWLLGPGSTTTDRVTEFRSQG